MKVRSLTRLVSRELVLYAVFGVLTSVINFGLFALLVCWLDYRISNIIALIVTIVCAYVLNRMFVFKRVNEGLGAVAREFYRFVLSRTGTLVIEFFGLIALVSVLDMKEQTGKILVTVVVVALNYLIGKIWVYVPKT
jgi:putative flippase GtrA